MASRLLAALGLARAPAPRLSVLMVCLGITRRPYERADGVRNLHPMIARII